MTTNDKPVCYQCRVLFADGAWSDWYDHESSDSRDRHAEHFKRIGHDYETRDLYDRPQPAAPQVPEGWRVMRFTGSWQASDERWEVYSPDGSGGSVNASDVADPMVRDLLDALATPPASSPRVPDDATLDRMARAWPQGFDGGMIRAASIDERKAFLRDALVLLATPPAPEQPKTDVRERLADIQRRLEARGVVDVKLVVAPGASAEKVALDAAEFLAAYLEGRYVPAKPIGDGAEQPKPAGDVLAEIRDVLDQKQQACFAYADDLYNLAVKAGAEKKVAASISHSLINSIISLASKGYAFVEEASLSAQPAQGEGEK